MLSSSRQYPLEELLGPDPYFIVRPVGRPHRIVDFGRTGRQPPPDLIFIQEWFPQKFSLKNLEFIILACIDFYNIEMEKH